MAQSPCSTETTTYITTGGAKRGDRGVRLENTRLCKRRGVLTEVLTRLSGWQAAVSQERLAVGKELYLA